MAKLKPCPFCGGKAEVNAMGWKCKDGKDRYFVECYKCGTRCGYKALPINQAIEKWNKRTTEIVAVETNFYDKEEIYEDCTVQVLTNTATGETSVGWWRNGGACDD